MGGNGSGQNIVGVCGRATLPSGLAALGVPKSDRKLLGRWIQKGLTSTLGRTTQWSSGCRQNLPTQSKAVRKGYLAFDEGSILEGLKVWLCEKWAVEQREANAAVDEWKTKLRPATSFRGMVGK